MITTQNPNAAFDRLFRDALSDEGIRIELCRRNDRRVQYSEKHCRYTDEKFILRVSTENGCKTVRAECSGEKSAFYALCEIAKRCDDGSLYDGETAVCPSFPVRGYIEGFYGKPWSHEERRSVMALMAKNRMNAVYYAPKDDPYHRDAWREPYPENELNRLRELIDDAAAYYMDFYWCVAPGLSMKYADSAEFEALMQKTKQMYDIGVRRFGLLLDDISEELPFREDRAAYGETVNAHIELIHKYYRALMSLDADIRLTVCPTLYHGRGNEYYISKFGQSIPPQVSVFWTGRDVCSRELTSLEALRFIEGTHHKPLYWDNYPVNDGSMYNEMHLGPIINRDPDLWKYSEGIISNCMEYAECSKIPLITFAHYLWDSEGYDPERAWADAIGQVVGKENTALLLPIADHMFTSCLKDENSRRMNAAFDKIETLFAAGKKEEAFENAAHLLAEINACRDFLQQDLPICRELTKWSEKFSVACDILNALFALFSGQENGDIEQVFRLIDRYDAIPARLTEDMDIREELTHLLT